MTSSEQEDGASEGKLGLASGVGLCVASMVGSGIFLSSGYMAQEMSASAILAAWACGAALALLGVKTYAELARQVPRSGGEYRYLREYMHPAVAYVAGWATVVLGFAAPTAINALAATAFLGTLVTLPHPKVVAASIVLLIAGGHLLGRTSSRWLQDLLVIAKVLLLIGFVALGLVAGSHEWPKWEPPTGDTSVAAFFGSLFYVSYAFSGWNTSAYAAETFRRPRVDVGRAMVIACLLVAGLYLVINFIFVANLNPTDAAAVMGTDQATLGHLVTTKLAGVRGAQFMSVLAVMSFVSAISAMLMIGPHISATMASDGALPSYFAAKEGKNPRIGVVFQAAVALLVILMHDLQQALESVGATLILFSGLTAAALVLGHFRGRLPSPASAASITAAVLYALFSCVLLYLGFRDQTALLPWLGGAVLCALVGYRLTARS